MNKLLKNTILTVAGAGALVGVGQAPLPNLDVPEDQRLVAQKEQIVGYEDIADSKVKYAFKTDDIVPQVMNEVIEKRKENEITVLKSQKVKKIKGENYVINEYSTSLLGYPQFVKEEDGQWYDLEYAETTKEAYEKQTGPQKVIDLITGYVMPNTFATTTTYITSGTSWAGATTDGSNITVECIGGGGGGGGGTTSYVKGGGGGGGGEYAKKVVAYTSGSTVNGIQIGQGGNGVTGDSGQDGTETHWNTNVVIAKPGIKGGFSQWRTGGAGGTGGTGDTTYNGGTGGTGGAGDGSYGGGGGGGAGGLNAAGNNGSNGTTTGGAGGQGDGTYGGTGGNPGTEWDSTHGSGGGGNGGSENVNGSSGGLYGAGGGGAGANGSISSTGGAGKNGLIVITYTAVTGPVNIKDWQGLVKASISNINGLAPASVKGVNGLE